MLSMMAFARQQSGSEGEICEALPVAKVVADIGCHARASSTGQQHVTVVLVSHL